MKLHLISDLHLRTEVKHNKVVAGALKKLREDLGPEDYVVVAGDITDDGREKQYAHALVLLDPFRGHLVMVPGNHDYGAWGNLYLERCKKRFVKLQKALGADAVGILSMKERPAAFLHLDTCLKTGSIVDFAQGRVGFWRRLWLKRRLKALKKNWTTVVIAHHDPNERGVFLRLQDAKQFLEVVLGEADHVLTGHTHRPSSWHYPLNMPEAQAQTRFHNAGALCQGEGPLVIDISKE